MGGPRRRTQAKGHHAVPQHLLRRFADDSERLTVVRLLPVVKLLRRQHAREVGTRRRLNSWLNPDGSYDDELETGPMSRLDTASAAALDHVRQFAIDAGAAQHVRLLNWTPEQRVPLYLFVAGQMARSPELRARLDECALPTLKKEMLARLEAAVEAGTTREEDVEPIRLAAKRESGFVLEPGANRHQAILLPLIETVTAGIGSRFIVGVRRMPKPILVTGSEPVVLFESHRISRGRSFARLLTERHDPVRLWDGRPAVLAHVDQILGDLAGLAVAIDPETLVVMLNPDLAEGGKLTWVISQLDPVVLGETVNLMVTGGSQWIAGRDDVRYVELLASAATRPA